MGDSRSTIDSVYSTLENLKAKLEVGGLANCPELIELEERIRFLEADAKHKESREEYDNDVDRDVFEVPNPFVQKHYNDGRPDFLYHLGTIVTVKETAKYFKDVRYVCVGGTPGRMHEMAVHCLDVLDVPVPSGLGITDLCGGHARYVMYKAGPVLTVSHGMGNPSMSIMLQEVLKLLHYARASKSVKFVRIGTCGGVGVKPGTTVISEEVYNGSFQNYYEQHVLGKPVQRLARLDKNLVEDLIQHAGKPGMDIPVVAGNTLCADDFYEQQGRLDGAFCEYTHQERIEFLQRCSQEYGIRNIEMESLVFAALTRHAGVAAAVVCVALVNRLEDDKVDLKVEHLLEEWQRRPQRLVGEMIKAAEETRRDNNRTIGELRSRLVQTGHDETSDKSSQGSLDSAVHSQENSRAETPTNGAAKLVVSPAKTDVSTSEAQLKNAPGVVKK